MSIYDNAGVALIPSGTKASKLYSVLPANGNGDFTHDRNLTTATRVNKDGLIEGVAADVPRLDYPLIDGVVQDCPALLLEPQRTNIVTYSENFTQSVWTKNNVTIDSNSTISPYGTLNASTLENGTGNKRLQFSLTSLSVGSTYAVSVFFKSKGDSTEGSIIAYNSSVTPLAYAEYDVENGTIGTNSGGYSTIENYGNGWYRCSLNFTATTTIGYLRYRVGNYLTGDDNKDIFIFGSQVELGSYQTSYIPTSGGIATRSADACNGSGTSADINSEEGVLFLEFAALANDLSNRRISISNSTTSNLVRVGYDTTSNRIIAVVYNGSNQAVLLTTSYTITDFHKVAVKYKQNDFALWVDGTEVSTDTNGTTFAADLLSELAFDNGSGGNLFFGKVKQALVFNEALSDSEFETLTSWDSFNAMAKGQLYTIE